MPSSLWLRSELLLALLALSLTLTGESLAMPTVGNATPRGLQIGGTTTLTLQGSDLQGETRLLAPFAIAKQELLAGATAQQAQLQITLGADVAPGLYAVRIANAQGISAPLMLGIDRLAQITVQEKLEQLPVAQTGTLSGGQIVKTSFVGQQGLPLVVDVEALRLGANFKPVLRLYDSRGKQVAWSGPKYTIGGDARLAIALPATDTYTVELHDLLYRAGGNNSFRLKIGDLQYADFVLPLGVQQGTSAEVKFQATNLPAGATVAVVSQASDVVSQRTIPAPPVERFTGALPRLQVSRFHEALETPPTDNQKQRLADLPSAVSGVIAHKAEEDQYLVPVTAGQKLRIDVRARQLGSLLDGVLIVRNAQGQELARNDDQPNTADPGLEFTVPANVSELLLGVRDMESRSGDEFVYRLEVRDAGTPDVVATINTDTIQIPAGGTTVLPVNVMRTNYNGPLQIVAEGLVGDVQLAGDVIPAGASTTLLTLSAQGGHPVHGLVRLVIKATEPNVNLVRYVLGPQTSGAQRYQPWLQQDLGLAVVEPAPFNLAWNEVAEQTHAFAGSQWALPLQVTRREGVTGDIRLRVLTTQAMPKKTIKENNQDKEVDDVERALRLAGDTANLKPDVTTSTAQLVVPGDLESRPWGVVVVGELLAADGKTVIGSSNTRFRQLEPQAPFVLELQSAPQAEGRAGAGAAGQFTGKLTRRPGFTQPIAITLTGLPAEVKNVPQVMLTAEQTDFQLPLTFAADSKQGDYPKIKLAAFVPGSPQPSAAAEVNVKIVAGDSP